MSLDVINTITEDNEPEIHDYDYIKGIFRNDTSYHQKILEKNFYRVKRINRLIDAILPTRSRYT